MQKFTFSMSLAFRSLTLRMAEKWSTLHGWSLKESVDKYLENTRRWPFFGCKLFQAQVCDPFSLEQALTRWEITTISVFQRTPIIIISVCGQMKNRSQSSQRGSQKLRNYRADDEMCGLQIHLPPFLSS